MEHFIGHGDHWDAFGVNSEQIAEIIQKTIQNGSVLREYVYKFPESNEATFPLIYPENNSVQVCSLHLSNSKEQSVMLKSIFPFFGGYKNSVVIHGKYSWGNDLEGEIEVMAEGITDGRENISFFSPFFIQNFEDIDTGVKVDVYLAGLAYSIEPVLDIQFKMDSGRYYEMELENFLAENPTKSKDDFPYVLCNTDGLVALFSTNYYSEFQYRGKILELNYEYFENKKFAKVKICILRDYGDDKLFIYIYILEEKFNDYIPKIGDNIQGVVWLLGYTKK